MTDVVIISAQVSAVAIVLIIASVLTDKKYRVGWRYYVFILLAVRLLIPVRLTLPFTVVNLPKPLEMPPVMEYIEQVPETGNVYEEFEVSQNSEPVQTVKKRVITPTGVLYIIWLGGAAGIIIWNMGRFLYVLRRLKRNSVFLKKCRRIEVRLSDKIESPFLIGYIKPYIFIPEGIYTNEEQEKVILHEMTHYRRGDLWVKLLFLFALAVHWFNPVIHIMIRRAVRDMEYSCDDAAIREKDDEYRREYCKVILKTIKERGRRK